MKKIFFFVVASIILLCCKKQVSSPPSPPSPPANEYDPNKPSFRAGTKWVYRYIFYSVGGSISSEDSVSYQIIRDTTINGAKYFMATYNYFFSNKPDGYYEYDKNLNREDLIYKNPVTNMQTYSGQYVTLQPGTCILNFNAQVKNTDTSATINGKTYDKLISYLFTPYSLSCQTRRVYSYELFSSKMGLRIVELFYDNDILAEQIELKSFTY